MEAQRPDGSGSARDPAKARRARWVIVVAAVVVIALAAQGIWSRHTAHAALERDAEHTSQMSVEVVRPQKSSAGLDLVLPGNVQAFLDTPIYARTNGYLKKWYADIGARVKSGQLLAEIDTPEVDDQLRAARADLANANANYALAKSTADRWTEMLKSKSVSKQETDEKVGDMLAKKATLDAARFNVARLEKTQSFQKVYAPFDGTVTARNVDVGALIDAGSAGGPAKELFHVAQADWLRVYVNLPQAYAQQVRARQTAFLTLTETPSRHYPGTVARTAGAVDQQQRTMLVEVDVDNRNGELLPGAYAQVHFALGAGAAPFTLPGNALLFRPDGVKVATVDAQRKVKLLPVSLGTDFGTRVAIASGLRGDEQVILNPQDSIVDGAAVRIVPRKVEGEQGAAGAAGGASGSVAGASGAAAKGEEATGTSNAAASDEKTTNASTSESASLSPTIHASAQPSARALS
ncbi:efflux RND transporter periplasmic adaptor subunit [Paraburkholderia panacisoli]|uniref:Efflux RND transporter periplasmic adaptor subunit n=1 Tax=Paraburkholderia panacisoli TaxID=2603818 RepID=A0A5B0HIP1_9BURK|nr:efflux RND transporter periplasmic adaptor subunit [Paraburkholderia panacisoli]KAA1015169.1 efflux RND transporter periplasmic adaptor subunit [Paraburkholderia panacisoli]